MNKAHPVDMRKALEVANAYKQAGILFVPMPVFSEEERNAKQQEANERLERMATEMEGNDE